MRYRTSLEIGIAQTWEDPAWTFLPLEYGYITEVEILFPAGHAGLTYVQIYYQSRQIFPLTPGSAFRGDDHAVKFNEKFPLLEVPHELLIIGWAPESTLVHEVFVGITIEAVIPPVELVADVPLPEGM